MTLILLTVFPWEIVSAEQDPPAALIISKIKIRATDIFDFERKPYLKKFPYTWINGLHIQTQRDIIEQELLFKEGDQVDEFLLEETERNLRALPFIRSARVAKFPQRDGTVTVVVYVNDSWTTEPQLNLSGSNGVDEMTVAFEEKNLLGRGKNIDVSYSEDNDIITRKIRYEDPRVLGTRWRFKGETADRSDGQDRILETSLPYFSAGTRWSGGAKYSKTLNEVDEYQNNVKVNEFDEVKENVEVKISAKIGGGFKTVNRLGPRYLRDHSIYNRNEDTPEGKTVPQGQKFQTIYLDWEFIQSRYIKLTKVEKMTRIEDYNLGPEITLSPGITPKSLNGGEDSAQLSNTFEMNFLSPRRNFVRTEFKYSGREIFKSGENQLYSLTFRGYYRRLTKQTLVLHTRAEWGDSLDPNNEVILGNQNGLRAWELEEVIGSKSFVANLEDRLFFIEELWALFSVGGVVFWDVGGAWDSGKPVAFSDMLNTVGAGVRIGLTRSSNETIIRVDISRRLNKSIHNNDDWVVTFGTGQAF